MDYKHDYGTVTGAGDYTFGKVTLKATPAAGCVFEGFELKSCKVGKMTGWDGKEHDGVEEVVTTHKDEKITLTDNINQSYTVKANFDVFDEVPEDMRVTVKVEVECTDDAEGWNSSTIPIELVDTAGTQHSWEVSRYDLDAVGEKQSHTFYIGAAEGYTLDQAEEVMKNLLLERFNEDDDAFSISSQNMIEEAMGRIGNFLNILLGGIAAISLIVGGIGIMNIMLVTVTERTREIGIRKAIGASRRTILVQFLIEAVVLCMLGCALGIFVSWGILQIISAITVSASISFRLNGRVVVLSVLFCFLIGVIFGLYPANKAAKMKPIDALHYGG